MAQFSSVDPYRWSGWFIFTSVILYIIVFLLFFREHEGFGTCSGGDGGCGKGCSVSPYQMLKSWKKKKKMTCLQSYRRKDAMKALLCKAMVTDMYLLLFLHDLPPHNSFTGDRISFAVCLREWVSLSVAGCSSQSNSQ